MLGTVLIVWLVVGNVVSFALFGIDKRRAQRGDRRIPESTLIASAALTGTVGAWLAMRHFRHKTRKASFITSMLLASAADAVVLWALFLR